MLKHVSYRASNTSLSRPFGNCRTSNTLPTSTQCGDKVLQSPSGSETSPNKCQVIPASAPNSPQISSSYSRHHMRHHSITPSADKFMPHEEEFGHITPRKDGSGCGKRNTYTEGNSPKVFTHQRAYQQALEMRDSTDSGHDTSTDSTAVSFKRTSNFCEDTISLKADDPLSLHKNDLRSLDSITLRGELICPDSTDSISLYSGISLGTLSRNDLRSSTMSLCNSSSSTSSASKVPVRIHLRQLRPDIEYKTLKLDPDTTCRQLIEHLLHKLRLKHRDPNLFAIVLEAAVRGPAGSAPIKKRFLLEDSARPVELQQCRPWGEANFSITMRRGGVLRVRDSVLTPGSQYKSFLVSYTSNVVEVIQLLLRCNNRTDDWRMFTLHELCSEPYGDRVLNDEDKPLYVQNSWPKDSKHKYSLVLRRHLTQGLIENRNTWRCLSIDECSLDADVELDEHNSTCSSIMTNSSNSSRSRSSISSSTASVLSLASLSSDGSSRCSFSSGSSSGVSSGSSSSSYSPTDTPDKDRKNTAVSKRLLPPTPCTPKAVSKIYPRINVEENIQSYFTMPSDDDLDCDRTLKTPQKKCGDITTITDMNLKTRPPQPLPRRILSFPAAPMYVNSAQITITDKTKMNKNLRKSFSAIYTQNSTKARGPAAQSWQNRSRSARIRSATISSPIEHMANLSLYSRSKFTENHQQNISTTTLTSQPTTPSTPISSNSMFSFKSIPFLSKSQSTSSINNPNSPSKFLIDHPVIIPSSTKLRPLSLAPNSCVMFPSMPTSLLSSQSQSTSTLRASSSSVCLMGITSSPDRDSNCSFVTSTSSMLPSSPSSLLLDSSFSSSQFSSSQSFSPSSLSLICSPTKSVVDAPKLSNGKSTDKINNNNNNNNFKPYLPVQENKAKSSYQNNSSCNNIKTTSDIKIISMQMKPEHKSKINTTTNGSENCNGRKSNSNDKENLSSDHFKVHGNSHHCRSSCRYDSCFYI